MRNDLKIITDLVESKAKLLDIGCGEGELLDYLAKHKQVDGRGIEISQQKVSVAVSRGLSVIQGDADIDLRDYPDKSFDYTVLGQTIQATKNPKDILEQMLRIAERAIVSFPNFGYWKNRLYLTFKGKMPVTQTLAYQWYETPNIHFCTIQDFINLCKELGIKIEKQLFLTADGEIKSLQRSFILPANLFSEFGVFLLSK